MKLNSGFAPSLTSEIMKDEVIFGPPALSAYSIAILSANSSSQGHLSSGSISEAEIKDNRELKDSLKRKFSVHFGDLDSGLLLRRISPDTSMDIKAPRVTTNISDVKLSNISNYDLEENNFNQAVSPGLTNTSSGSSLLGRSGHSPNTHNSSSNFHELNPGVLTSLQTTRNDDSGLHSGSFLEMKPADPSHPLKTPNQHSSLSIKSIGHTIKRSKLSHNLRSLGPPKRAFELTVNEREKTSPDKNNQSSPFVELPMETHKSIDNILLQNNLSMVEMAKGTNLLDSLTISESYATSTDPAKLDSKPRSQKAPFFKSLEELKNHSSKSPPYFGPHPFRDNASKPNSTIQEEKNSMKSTEFNVFLDPKDRRPLSRGITNFEGNGEERRVPLHDISNLASNLKTEDLFLKPKPPRPVSVGRQADMDVHVTSKSTNVLNSESYNSKKLIVVNSQQYEKLEILGRGGSSKVYKVRHLNSRKVFAIKKVEFDQFDESCINGFKSEIEHLTKLKNNSRVISLEDHCILDGSIFMVMECGELDLSQVLQKRMATEPILDVNFVRFNVTELFKCVQAVHQAGIVHSDLKPANFLFVSGLMKIIDFGIANAVPEHTANIYRESQIGTPNYMAPETLIEAGQASCPSSKESGTIWKVGKPSDVWSCGCMLYQMIYGRPPYAAFSGQKRIQAIMNPETVIIYPETGLGGVKVPQSAVILMQGCLDRIPGSRWSIEECLDSDFLKPKIVSRAYIRNLIYSAINFGMENRNRGDVSRESYDQLVETVINQIEDLNFA